MNEVKCDLDYLLWGLPGMFGRYFMDVNPFFYQIPCDIGSLFSMPLNANNKWCGVYLILNTSTRHGYVGSAENIYGRVSSHRAALIRNDHSNSNLQNDFNIYGRNGYSIVFLYIPNREHAYDLEGFIIAKLKGMGLAFNFGIDPRVAARNSVWSEESRISRMATFSSLEYKKMLSDKHLGVPLSESHRENIIAALRAKGITQQHRNTLIAANGHPVAILGVNYRSIREAANSLDISNVTLSRWVNKGIADVKITERTHLERRT